MPLHNTTSCHHRRNWHPLKKAPVATIQSMYFDAEKGFKKVAKATVSLCFSDFFEVFSQFLKKFSTAVLLKFVHFVDTPFQQQKDFD